MKNVLTVFALMVSLTGVGVSLAREEVRCYLGLSSSACQSATETYSSGRKANSSPSTQTESSSAPQQTEEIEEKSPVKLPSAIEEITKVGKEAIAPSESSSQEVTNPIPQAEEPLIEAPQVSQQPTQPTTEVSAPTYAQPITEPVELEVIPFEENSNSSQSTQN